PASDTRSRRGGGRRSPASACRRALPRRRRAAQVSVSARMRRTSLPASRGRGRAASGRRRPPSAPRTRARGGSPAPRAAAAGAGALDDEPPQLRRLERHRAAVLPEDPAREQRRRGVLGDEDVAFHLVAGTAVGTLDPPRGVRRDLDARTTDDISELPFGAAAIVLDVELRRQPEVALAA